MAAKRGLELAEGQKPLIEVDILEKPTTVALQEILAGMLTIEPALASANEKQ